jgi:hypothetical protein
MWLCGVYRRRCASQQGRCSCHSVAPSPQPRLFITQCVWAVRAWPCERVGSVTAFLLLPSPPQVVSADSASRYRISTVNADYGMCPSYPGTVCVPMVVPDEGIRLAAQFRSKGRCACALTCLTLLHVCLRCRVAARRATGPVVQTCGCTPARSGAFASAQRLLRGACVSVPPFPT